MRSFSPLDISVSFDAYAGEPGRDGEQFAEALSAAQRIGQMLTRLMQYLRTAPNRPSSTSGENH